MIEMLGLKIAASGLVMIVSSVMLAKLFAKVENKGMNIVIALSFFAGCAASVVGLIAAIFGV